ncbi:hypothetical protein [Microbispora sp. KK1-11]|uniref:hypothetical protein n=1 Tax=Microbispora sp. KK1-11 TaxID=2053005 RepID=UPI0011584A9C|nr:hypothetical protein [Microbispora sp. KK1-11]TQS29133.1 hypothetical protein FLW16_12365 [Microbispora sp. KK1-11]
MATLVSLEEAKAHLNISSGTDDAEILRMVEGITAPIERIVGSVLPASYTERHDGWRPGIALRHRPVQSVTSVTLPGGAVLGVDGYELDGDAGVLTRLSGGREWVWEDGRITVVYTAGMAEVPANVKLAALIVLQHMWKTQRGTSRDARFGGGGEEQWTPGMGFTLPRRALELLGDQVSGIA